VKLLLDTSTLPWLARGDRRLPPRVRELPVDEESALHVGKLPRSHGDPFDRILVCQAIVHGLTIVTPDPEIIQCPARTIW
jgi:PIN domain nuclease of toxin-antitoxin system